MFGQQTYIGWLIYLTLIPNGAEIEYPPGYVFFCFFVFLESSMNSTANC
jgi:hypothetical protein